MSSAGNPTPDTVACDTDYPSRRGQIFDIQRFSIHDGPGIRTTVFLKGCPLRCLWCHNPESHSSKCELSFLPEKCIGCGYCFQVCPTGSHVSSETAGHVLKRDSCCVCGQCCEQCYAGALEIIGREATVTEVLDEVMKDEPFYETSGGGMTLSGGEPLMQMDFTAALLSAGKARGLHTAVETAGFADFADLARLLPTVDLWLYDVKETDPERHRACCGVPNEGILSNLRRLHDDGAAVIVRLPIIPGLNDRDDHFRAVAELLDILPDVQGAELMPYHRLGVGKHERLGIGDAPLRDTESPSDQTVNAWIDRFAELGVTVLNERR